jgi:hypothetical protein
MMRLLAGVFSAMMETGAAVIFAILLAMLLLATIKQVLLLVADDSRPCDCGCLISSELDSAWIGECDCPSDGIVKGE